MPNDPSNLFYRQPRLLIVTLAIIVVAGFSALALLPRMEDPRMTVRWATLITRLPGATAERVDALVTDKLEEQLQEVEQLAKIESSSRVGVSVIQVEVSDDVTSDEVETVWSQVRDKLDDARAELPAGASETEFENDNFPAMTLLAAVTWRGADEPNLNVLSRLAEQLEDELRAVPGTEHTELHGDAGEEIRVEVDQQALASLGLTARDVAERIQRADAKVAAGLMRNDRNNLLIEVSGEVDSLERVRQIDIRLGDEGQFVTLQDVATISKAVADPPRRLALADGHRAVVVGARMIEDARIDQWAEDARAVVTRFGEGMTDSVEVSILFDQSGYTETRLAELTRNFLLAIAAVTAVIFVMMGWRSAVLVASALPLAALMVLAGMKYLGVPIHQMSATGLIIALGLLIDNAIVMVDEINTRRREGLAAGEAISRSVRHLGLPLFGSTVTTVLAFMPIVLMPGGAGEFVGAMALGVILALISSLFLSMTVVPALAGLIGAASMRGGESRWWRGGVRSAGLTSAYERVLGFLFARPVLGVAVSLALPVAGLMKSGELVEQFFPPADRDQFQLQIRLPDQASIHQTHELVQRASQIAKQDPKITALHWFLGDSAPLFYYNLQNGEDDSPNFAQALVQMSTEEGGAQAIHRLQQRLQDAMPQAQVLALQLEQGPPFPAPIELRVYGPDRGRLAGYADEARRVLSQVPDVIATRSTVVDSRPKLWFKLDEQEARLAGYDNLDVAGRLEASLEGVVGGSMLEGAEELPVRVRLSREQRTAPDRIASLDLLPGGRHGAMVGNTPLSALGELKLTPELANLERRNGQPVNRVFGFVTAGVLPGKVLADYKVALDRAGFALPPGYRLEWGGESGERDRAVGNLMGSVAVIMVLMVTTLVLSFNSFRIAGILGGVALASVGLSLGALWVFGYPFGFMAIVGAMGLIGVAINDSIVVLAAIREDEGARVGDQDAMRRVVLKSTRHVLSTTVTTVAGFTPLVLAGGGFWPPLAVSIAGGVVGATFLALTFAPSAYLMLACRGQRRVQVEVDQHALVNPAFAVTQ